ncbi:MAG: hypothetical protein J6U54_07780 [Clostridiales bacterium]|nr:hypothetical protein [Clostridiales bacterium]
MKKVVMYVLGSIVFLAVIYIAGLALLGVNVFEKEDKLVVKEATEAGTIAINDVQYCLLVTKLKNNEERQLIIPNDWYAVNQISEYEIEIKHGNGEVMTLVENEQIVDYKIMICYKEE